MADVGHLPAVREEFATNRKRRQRPGSVDVDDGLGVLRVRVLVVVVDARQEVEGGVADRAGVPGEQNGFKRLSLKIADVLSFMKPKARL